MLEITIIISVLAILFATGIPLAILISYRKGYNFGNSLSDETMDKFKKISDENVKLKERDVALSSIAIKFYKQERNALIQGSEEDLNSMEEYEKQARKKALGEYGDMFKEEIEDIETKGESENFSTNNMK